MLKSGNFNISQNLCPRAGGSLRHAQNVRNVAYGTLGPMNQPLVFHNWSSSDSHEGAFYGTYDVDPKSETYSKKKEVYFFHLTLYYYCRFVVFRDSLVQASRREFVVVAEHSYN